MSAITHRAVAACRAGMEPSTATAAAIRGRSISPGARERIEMICAADREGRERARIARRAQCAIDRMVAT